MRHRRISYLAGPRHSPRRQLYMTPSRWWGLTQQVDLSDLSQPPPTRPCQSARHCRQFTTRASSSARRCCARSSHLLRAQFMQIGQSTHRDRLVSGGLEVQPRVGVTLRSHVRCKEIEARTYCGPLFFSAKPHSQTMFMCVSSARAEPLSQKGRPTAELHSRPGAAGGRTSLDK